VRTAIQYDIRELTLGGILDQAITLMKNHFGSFVAIMAITWLPVQLANVIATETLLADLATLEDPDAIMRASAEYASLFIGLYVLNLLVALISNAAIVYAIANAYLGKRITVGGSIGKAFGLFFPLLWTLILVGVAIMGGFILLIVPGILAAFWFSLATQVVVVEGVSGFKALGRSRQIMRGNIGTLFVMGLVLGLIGFAILGGSSFISERYVQAILNVTLNMVLVIFSSAAGVVFYFSARCKNEQFDLQLLASNVGSELAADEAEASDELFTPEG
jgi:uncharacterized membrane protein